MPSSPRPVWQSGPVEWWHSKARLLHRPLPSLACRCCSFPCCWSPCSRQQRCWPCRCRCSCRRVPSVGMPLSILMRSSACGQDRHQPSTSSPPSAPWVTILGAGCIRLFRSRRYRTAPGCSGTVVSLPWLSQARVSERHVVLARSRHCRDPFVFCVDGGWVSALQAYRRRINRVEAMVRSNVTVMRMNETAPPNGQLFCCAKVEKTSGPMVWNFGPPRSTGVA